MYLFSNTAQKIFFFSFLLFCLSNLGLAQSVATVDRVRVVQASNTQLDIFYDIADASPDEVFQVWLKVLKVDGEEVKFTAPQGALGENISGGIDKKISIQLSDNTNGVSTQLYVEISIRSNLALARSTRGLFQSDKSKRFLKSLIFPGWGQSSNSNKPYWLLGVIGYGSIAGSYLFNQQADDKYNSYLEASTLAERNALFKDAENARNTSRGLAFAAGTIWVGNLIWVLLEKDNNSKSRNLQLRSSNNSVGLSLSF